MGPSGRKIIMDKLPKLIESNKIDFVIINGENSADSGAGITKKIFKDLIDAGADVVTTGNHVWDEQETLDFIKKENRLLRPENLIKGSPGNGFGIFNSRNNKKVAVVNLMGNIFMKKCENVFEEANNIIKKIKLKIDADFIIVDMHGEITSEKKAIGFLFDGKATMVVGTHTHIPTSDHMILKGGTAYQTDIGMCGDYDSVIGMNKENSIKKFLKHQDTKKHFPAVGKGTLSGLMVTANEKTGLATSLKPIVIGSHLENRI